MTLTTLLPQRYGASELKASYNRNLLLAFLLALVIFGAAIAIYSLLVTPPPIIRRGVTDMGPGPIWIQPSADKPKTSTQTGAEEGGKGSAGGSTAPSGRQPARLGPIKQYGGLPLPASMSLNNGFSFTDVDPNGALNGTGTGTVRDTGNPEHDGRRRQPSSTLDDDRNLPADVPVFAEKEPTYDEGQLMKAVAYPEIARRAGIEGRVVVRVLIDRAGRPVKTMIDYSDNPAFIDAAVKAVTSIVYTPAIQNKTPVAVWMQIPITFTIDR